MFNHQITGRLGTEVGLIGGFLWGLDTVLLARILSHTPYIEFVVVAPLIATFLHDLASSSWLLLFTGARHQLGVLWKSLNAASGRWVALAALCGGPIGMTGYVLSIQLIGSANTAIVSSMYPAFGVFLNYLVFRTRLKIHQIIGLLLAVLGTSVVGIISSASVKGSFLGVCFALLCVIGWGSESVISAYGMKSDLSPELALQIRQLTSSTVYLLIIIPLIHRGFHFTCLALLTPGFIFIVITALAGTLSYLCYYKSIDGIGPVQAMGLNISYSAWSVFIGIFFGQSFNWLLMVAAFVIITGSILTTDRPQDFFRIK